MKGEAYKEATAIQREKEKGEEARIEQKEHRIKNIEERRRKTRINKENRKKQKEK